MEFTDVTHTRRSVRQYDPERAPDATLLRQILTTACQAPSSGNLQCCRFVVVDDVWTRRKLRRAAFYQRSVETAPVTMVLCADLTEITAKYGPDYGLQYALMDVGIVASYVVLAVNEAGLHSCCVGGFEPDLVSETLGLPATWKPCLLIPMGYGDLTKEPPQPTKRGPDALASHFAQGTLTPYGKAYPGAASTSPVST